MGQKENNWAAEWEKLFGALAVEDSVDEKLEKSRAGAEQRSFGRRSHVPNEARKSRQEEWDQQTKEWTSKSKVETRSVGKLLGEGGQGKVFRLDSTDKDCSALIIKTPKIKPQDRGYNDAIKDLEYEAEMYEKVGSHPNIARCLGVKTVGNDKGLVMEAITGGDMADAITDLNEQRRTGKISEEQYWGMLQFNALRTIEALAYMEEQGFIHHDIKSPNIMIDAETGEPKIIDLGITTETGKGARGDMRSYGHTPNDGLSDGATSKADMFSVGGMLYEVLLGNTGDERGEGKSFDYGGGRGFDLFQFQQWAGKTGQDAEALKVKPAVKKGDHDKVDQGEAPCPECNTPFALNQDKCPNCKAERAFVTRALCKKCGEHFDITKDKCPKCQTPRDSKSVVREKRKGKYGAQSSYVDFVNSLLSPNPKDRMSFAEALEHPFLKERLLDDESARSGFRELVQHRQAPKAPEAKGIAFATVAGLTEAAWSSTYQNAITAKAVPGAEGIAQSLRESLAIIEKGKDFDSYRAALDEVVRNVDLLLKKPPYSDNTTMKGYLDQLRQQAGEGPTFVVVRKFDAASWQATTGNAVAALAAPASPLLGAVTAHFKSVTTKWTAFKNDSAAWDVRSSAGHAALEATVNIKDDVKRLLDGPAGKNSDMRKYLEFMRQAADNDLKARTDQVELFVKAGKPRDLDLESLRAVWSQAKQDAEAQFPTARANQTGLPANTKFSQVLSFKDDFGAALKDVAAAAKKTNNDDKTRRAVDKAIEIVNGYFQMVNAAEKDWWSKNNQQKANPDFFDLFKRTIRDIVLALKKARP